jgi:hypothetical protein
VCGKTLRSIPERFDSNACPKVVEADDAIEPNLGGIQGSMHTLSAVYVNTMMYGVVLWC